MGRNKSLLAVSRFDQVRVSASAFLSTMNIFSAAEGFERHSSRVEEENCPGCLIVLIVRHDRFGRSAAAGARVSKRGRPHAP